MTPIKPDYPILPFKDSAEWRAWLAAHHAKTEGIWIRMYKKASGTASVTHEQALDEALCYGWIDGLRRRYDEVSFWQKFTPRRPKSLWSKRNIEHIARLTEAGLMTPAGMAEVERAKADGRWAAAYDAQADMVVPEDFLAELRGHPVAEKFFATLNKSNRFAVCWRLQTAKTPETRKRRMEKIIAQLDSEQKLQ